MHAQPNASRPRCSGHCATCPTPRVARSDRLELAAILARRGWEEVVVKPAVSASAWGTWRASRDSAREADERAAEQPRNTSLLVQPFIAEVATEGEWSLLFFGGRFSHAVLKGPKAGDFRVQSHHGGSSEAASPPPRLIAAAEHALSRVPGPWLYARVDGVESGGRFLLMELEMIEPCLFLGHAPGAAEALAEAILALPGRASAPLPKSRLDVSPETARAVER